MIGSKIAGLPLVKACLNEYLVAMAKAILEESTTWVAPSVKVYLTLTTGYPVRGPYFINTRRLSCYLLTALVECSFNGRDIFIGD